jgi:lysophospholipase L1-like esterase
MATWKKRLLIALLVPLGTVLVLEIASRVFFPLKALFPKDDREAAREFYDAGMFRSFGDTLRHFTLVPNLSVKVGAQEYRHNNFGLRGPDVTPKKPAAIFRIAVLGDSYTYGWGVSEKETIPARLKQELESAGTQKQREIEVINAGVPAYDTGPEYGMLRDVILPLKPDLVVLVFQTNDITTVDYFYLDEERAFYACPLPLPYFAKRALKSSRLYHLVRRAYTEAKTKMGFEWFGEREWPRTRHYLTLIAETLKREGIPLVIANLPHFQVGSSLDFSEKGSPRFSRQSNWVNELAKDLGVPCVDLLPILKARVIQERKLVEALYVDSASDHHLNAEGCSVVAGAIADEIGRGGLLP